MVGGMRKDWKAPVLRPRPPSTRVTDCPGVSSHSRSLKRVMVMLGAGVEAGVGVESAVVARRTRACGC
jgi:hypothetical protein